MPLRYDRRIPLRKKTSLAFRYCLNFLCGILIATAPWFLYFLINGALYDWFYTYFYVNIFVYGKSTIGAGIVQSIKTNFGEALAKNPIMLYGSAVAGVGFIANNKLQRGIWPKISLLLCVLFLVLGVYGGGKKYVYYFFIFYLFLVLALVTAAKLSAVFFKTIWSGTFSTETAKRTLIVAALFSILASSTASYYLSPNNTFMAVPQSDLAQFQFAKIIDRSKNPTLLNYGFLDGGFYTTAGVVPVTRYFCKNNVPDPQMMQAQNAIIRNKGVEFVVLRMNGYSTSPNVAYLSANYKQIDHVTQIFEGKRFTYLLYQAK